MVGFKEFLKEASSEIYSNLLDEIATLMNTVGEELIYIEKNNSEYTCVQLDGENYILLKVKGSDQNIIKTQKIYKDGGITNYDLALTRLKQIKSAIENEQFVPQQQEED